MTLKISFLPALQSTDCSVFSSTLLLPDQCVRYPNRRVTKKQDGADRLFWNHPQLLKIEKQRTACCSVSNHTVLLDGGATYVQVVSLLHVSPISSTYYLTHNSGNFFKFGFHADSRMNRLHLGDQRLKIKVTVIPCPSHTCKHDISGTSGLNIIKSCMSVHLDLRMN